MFTGSRWVVALCLSSVAVLGGAGGCNDRRASSVCAPGSVESCPCPEGRTGARICGSSGEVWGECTGCPAAPDGAITSGRVDARAPVVPAGCQSGGYTFATRWGSPGTGDGQFGFVMADGKNGGGVAVDSAGFVYVGDWANHRIQKFDASGRYVGQWGTKGTQDGQMLYPIGLAVDASDNVYVAEPGGGRIQKFDSRGTFLAKWGSSGQGQGQFTNPNGVAVAPSGEVYVADTLASRVQVFSSKGEFLREWGGLGQADGQFNLDYGIAVSPSGTVLVTDGQNHRVQEFDANGTFLAKWGGRGAGEGKLNVPTGIAIDRSGQVFVADYANSRVQKLTLDGAFVDGIGSAGTGDCQFSAPYSVAVARDGSLYVVDTKNSRIQKFVPSASAELELKHDDGTPDTAFSPWEPSPGGQAAVVFAPPFYPAKVKRVSFFVPGRQGVPTTPFRVRGYAAASEGSGPETDLLPAQVVAAAKGPDTWVTVDLSAHDITITRDVFVVAMEWLTAPGSEGRNAQFIGVDLDQPHAQSWARFSTGPWLRMAQVGKAGDRNAMIRAVVARE